MTRLTVKKVKFTPKGRLKIASLKLMLLEANICSFAIKNLVFSLFLKNED